MEWTRYDTIGRTSLALETNGFAYIGFLIELPGAFVRGRTKEEAILKVNSEASSYLRWLGITRQASTLNVTITQEHRSSLMVEDADCEILLEDDRGYIGREQFTDLLKLVRYSGATFLSLYNQSRLKDWVDRTRIRKTFYGANPKTIREIFDHVNGTQYYYLSRTQIAFDRNEDDYMRRREFCLEAMEELYSKYGNSTEWNVDNERWTLKKILRRFIWHDRIHGKAITKILESQRLFGLIEQYDNHFFFELSK